MVSNMNYFPKWRVLKQKLLQQLRFNSRQNHKNQTEEKDKSPTKSQITIGKQSELKRKMTTFKFEGQTEILKKWFALIYKWIDKDFMTGENEFYEQLY